MNKDYTFASFPWWCFKTAKPLKSLKSNKTINNQHNGFKVSCDVFKRLWQQDFRNKKNKHSTSSKASLNRNYMFAMFPWWCFKTAKALKPCLRVAAPLSITYCFSQFSTVANSVPNCCKFNVKLSRRWSARLQQLCINCCCWSSVCAGKNWAVAVVRTALRSAVRLWNIG